MLDGLTITAGNADGPSYKHQDRGGGILNSYFGTPTVIDCRIIGNSAARNGGGMYNDEGGPTLTGCTLSNNFAGRDGGGMFNHHQGPIMTNCIITDNFAAGSGGGIYNDWLYIDDLRPRGDLIMTNCIMVGNEAGENGGGVHGSGDNTLLTNCIFWDNIAYEGPQMAYGHAGTFIRHCCFQGAQFARSDPCPDLWCSICVFGTGRGCGPGWATRWTQNCL